MQTPYHQPLNAEAAPGLFVTVNGKFDGQNGVGVALAADRDDQDIPLYVSLRAHDQEVVFNNRVGGAWEKNENKHKMKLKDGDFFSLGIIAENKEFDIYINGDKVGSFNFRQPVSNVKMVNVTGDAVLESVLITNQITVPHEQSIKNLEAIRIAGLTKKNFNINLLDHKDNILLHISTRFSEKAIVLNTQVNGKWDNEIRPEVFPFTKNDIFDVVIREEDRSFKLKFNHEDYVTFEKRLLDAVVKLVVTGEDLKLFACQVAERAQHQQQQHRAPQQPTVQHLGGGGGSGGVTITTYPQAQGGVHMTPMQQQYGFYGFPQQYNPGPFGHNPTPYGGGGGGYHGHNH